MIFTSQSHEHATAEGRKTTSWFAVHFPEEKNKKINDCLVLSSRPPPMRLRHGEIQEFVNSYSLA